MPPPISKNLREQAENLLLSGLTSGQVAKQLGLNRNSVKNWAKGRPKSLVEMRQMAQQAIAIQLPKMAESRLSQLVRSNLGKAVNEQASVLARSSDGLTLDELKNTPDGQGLASVTKTVIESAEKVFGWSQEGISGIVSIGDIASLDDAIDVEEVKDTTTGGMTIDPIKPSVDNQ